MNKVTALSLIYSIPFYHYKERTLQFEIVERPNPYFPYYVIAGYDNQELINNSITVRDILIHQDTREMYINNYGEIIPLQQWILTELKRGLKRDHLPDSVIRLIREEISSDRLKFASPRDKIRFAR